MATANPAHLPSLSKEWIIPSLHPTVGVDEAGRGPLAGPVVAAAVILPDAFEPGAINDSKQMTIDSRKSEYERICSLALVGVGWASAGEIDRINILQATFLAMRRAVGQLGEEPAEIWVDGDTVPPGLGAPAHCLVKGDSRHLSIAAASIVAKTVRDEYMEAMARVHPGYGFESHFGYGTPEHRRAIEQLGPCEIHRMSFAPLCERNQPCLELDV